MTKHTPGPWVYGHKATVYSDVASAPYRICRINDKNPNTLADMRLIAAAPDLLEAARALVAEYKAAPITPDCLILKEMDALQEAIAKAEGRE